MQILGPEVGEFIYASLLPKSGDASRVPSVPPVDSHDILAKVQGSWYNLGHYSYQIPLNAFLRAAETPSP